MQLAKRGCWVSDTFKSLPQNTGCYETNMAKIVIKLLGMLGMLEC